KPKRNCLPDSSRWLQMGLSQADAARRLNVSFSVVYRLWNQFPHENSVTGRPVPGLSLLKVSSDDH
ncbi:hypothetical protein AVEN_244142-2-1, partial [Araneus ventricosus]